MQRDIVNNAELGKLGYEVFRFWEDDLKNDIDLCRFAKLLKFGFITFK